MASVVCSVCLLGEGVCQCVFLSACVSVGQRGSRSVPIHYMCSVIKHLENGIWGHCYDVSGARRDQTLILQKLPTVFGRGVIILDIRTLTHV